MTMQDEARLRVFQSAYESEAQDLREKLAQKKAKLKAAEARIGARISVRERKRRTRYLILIGSRPQGPPHAGTRRLPGTRSGPETVRPGPEGGVQMKGMYLGRRFYRQISGRCLGRKGTF